MKYYSLLGILIYLLVCSCNHSSKRSQAPQIHVRQNDDAVYSFDEGQTVSRLFIYDETLLAFTVQEPFFTLISIDERRKLCSFGRRGRAGDEMPGMPQGANLREGKIQFYNQGTKSLVYVSVPDGHVEARLVPYIASFRPMKMVEIAGKEIATGGLDQGRVAYVDEDQRIIIGEDYPFDTGTISGIVRGPQLQSDLVAAPDSSRFLIRTLASDCFELYEVHEDGIKRVFVNDFKYPPIIENNRADPGSNKAGYIRSFVDNDHVYLMYSDKLYRDASNEGLISDTIHVFDWEGNLLQILRMPEKIGAFCVKGTRVYGTIDYPDHTEVIEYEI